MNDAAVAIPEHALRVQLPAHGWEPRGYQRPAWDYLEGGGKRALLHWHRRAGKDDLALHFTACAMMQRVGTYWHMLPHSNQAKRVLWDAVNPRTNRRRIDDAFPRAMIASSRDTDTFIRFRNGSTWQAVGSDNYHSLLGSPPVGVVFSEWSRADPNAWVTIEPILNENDGWALFITTPAGKNHSYRMHVAAQARRAWFAQLLPASQSGVFTAEQLADARRSLIDVLGESAGVAAFEQDYECNFDAPIAGAIFPAELRAARTEGRIGNVPYDSRFKVYTAWDLGVGKNMAVWFYQIVGPSVNFIRFLSMSALLSFDRYAKALSELPYHYARHLLPHDAQSRWPGTGHTVEELARAHLQGDIRIGPKLPALERISAARAVFPRCQFDARLCDGEPDTPHQGVAALSSYHRKLNDRTNEYVDEPEHDWASHPADAFCYACLDLASAEDHAREQSNAANARPRRTIFDGAQLGGLSGSWLGS